MGAWWLRVESCGIRLDVIDFTTFRDQGNIRQILPN
jgi:hypothetical protein